MPRSAPSSRTPRHHGTSYLGHALGQPSKRLTVDRTSCVREQDRGSAAPCPSAARLSVPFFLPVTRDSFLRTHWSALFPLNFPTSRREDAGASCLSMRTHAASRLCEKSTCKLSKCRVRKAGRGNRRILPVTEPRPHLRGTLHGQTDGQGDGGQDHVSCPPGSDSAPTPTPTPRPPPRHTASAQLQASPRFGPRRRRPPPSGSLPPAPARNSNRLSCQGGPWR